MQLGLFRKKDCSITYFDPEDWINLVIKEEITHAMVVPTMLARIVEYLDNDSSVKITSLRALSYGGGKMRDLLLSARLLCFLIQIS